MKHGILISAVCISSILLFGCADKKKITDLEAANQSLQTEIQNLNVQLQANAADKTKIQELEQANQVLQAEIQKMHLEAVSAKEASVKTSAKKNVAAKSKGKKSSKPYASKSGAAAK